MDYTMGTTMGIQGNRRSRAAMNAPTPSMLVSRPMPEVTC